MNHVERFRAVMNFQPVDRLPQWEWATWWDKTVLRWRGEGLPDDVKDGMEMFQHFGLDPYRQFWISGIPGKWWSLPEDKRRIRDMDDYERLRPMLYNMPGDDWFNEVAQWAELQSRGEAVVWITLDGFFWYPRLLLGVEEHMLAFYDQPELMHRMNQDLSEWQVQLLERLGKVCRPTFMTFAEDMSYNLGPMLSEKLFDEFLLPYYRRVIPRLNELATLPIVDTDGDLTKMIPWLERAGLRGALPLERQAGVDGMAIRRKHPKFCLIGHYDKMVMPKGEAAMRGEFERLIPLMKSGGFIPSVDHQTPPGVSLENYRIYLRLLREYTEDR